VSVRLRIRGRGIGASLGDSPLARLASSWMSGWCRNFEAQCLSYSFKLHITGPM
jgi:hypothetical protein